MMKQVYDVNPDDSDGDDDDGDGRSNGWEAPVQLPHCQRPPAPAKNWSGDERKL